MTLLFQTAPDFTLPIADGGEISLSSLRPNWVVLFFYPRDDTAGCTREALDFSAFLQDFEALGTSIIGISKDTLKSHEKFSAKHGLKVVLASDADNDVCETYSVWVEKSMYGRRFMGIERATFLIDDAGTVRQVWRKVKVADHAEAVLHAVRASKEG